MPRNTTIVEDLVSSATLVNGATPYTSANIKLAKTSGAFALQVVYNNGTTVNVDFIAELSNDGTNFSDQVTINVTAASGNEMFDYVNGSGALYLRVRAVAAGGNLDIIDIIFTAKEDR